MDLPAVFSIRRFRTVFLVAGLLELIYLIVNIFILGGNKFVYALNSFLVSPLGIITALLAATLWRQMKGGLQNRLLWGGISLGWICWAIAETLWAIYSLAGKDSYPSWADFFFLLGYLPLFVGFFSRILGLPKKPERSQQVLIWVVSLIVIAVTTRFVLIPIIEEYDPQLLLESLLGVFYPLADLVLLLLVLNLLFTYGSGEYGLAWRLILVGFMTVTISDLLFSYADWNGLYYPDSKATLLSTLGVDVLYSTSYVLWALGIYALRVLLQQHRTLTIDFEPRLTTNTHIFFFTKRDETIIEVSRNYEGLFPQQSPVGRSLAEVLGISDREQTMIHNKLVMEKKLTDLLVSMRLPSGESLEGWLCGLPIINPPKEYSGSMILLRTKLEAEADNELSEYQKSMVPFVLEKTGSSENKSICLLFLDYYLAYIKSLFNLTLQEGGAAMSQALLDELQSQAIENGWQLQFNPQTILESANDSPAELGEALAALMETARYFATRLTDTMTVETEMQKIHSKFSQAVHSTVASLREMNLSKV